MRLGKGELSDSHSTHTALAYRASFSSQSWAQTIYLILQIQKPVLEELHADSLRRRSLAGRRRCLKDASCVDHLQASHLYYEMC